LVTLAVIVVRRLLPVPWSVGSAYPATVTDQRRRDASRTGGMLILAALRSWPTDQRTRAALGAPDASSSSPAPGGVGSALRAINYFVKSDAWQSSSI
jgi:hypothetical protein